MEDVRQGLTCHIPGGALVSAKRAMKIVALISLLSPMLAIGQTKTNVQGLMSIACDRDSCSVAVQSNASEELKFYCGTHVTLFHNVGQTDEQILALVQHGGYEQRNAGAKSIRCPEKDGVAIWSEYDDVLVFFFTQHALAVHNKELKDEEVRKLITWIQE